MNKKESNKNFSVVGYSLLISFVSLVIFFLSFFGFVDSVNNIFLDALQGETPARSEIVIVGIDDASLQEIGSWPWDRKIFADTFQNILEDDPSVIGIDVLFLESRTGDGEFQKLISESQTSMVFGSKIIDSQILKSIYEGTESGFVNFEPDPDGKIRQTISSTNINDQCELSFSLQIVSSFLFVNERENLCSQNLDLRSNTYQLNNDKKLTFAYTKSDFKFISIKDVYSGNFSEEFFKDKIVLIGSTALDIRSNLNDNFTGVFGDTVPGVEIHANIINSYLNGSFYFKPNLLLVAAIVLILNFLIAFIDLKGKKLYLGISLLLITIVLNFIISILLFSFGTQVYFVHTTIAFAVAFLLSIIIKYTLQNREARYIKGAFSRYLNPKLLDILMTDTTKLSLGGETKNMTVLFSDIRGFTSISEKMTPQELITMINDYLGFMTEIIFKNNGTIDKYIGDAIMAFWNAPVDDDEHAVNAVRTAVEMKRELARFKKEFPHYPEINIGIGVNSGDMTVGNVGGERRFDYTILGDNVNLGSRLEGLTKKYGVTSIVSENTFENFQKQAKDKSMIFRLLDEVKVKGKEVAIKIYEPLKSTRANKELKSAYEEAFSLYQNGDFKKAVKILKLISDPASEKLLERISEMKIPPKDWSGVWKWEEK